MDTPLKRLDPQALRDERSDLDLSEESTFNHVDHPDAAEDHESALDGSTAGATPPAR